MTESPLPDLGELLAQARERAAELNAKADKAGRHALVALIIAWPIMMAAIALERFSFIGYLDLAGAAVLGASTAMYVMVKRSRKIPLQVGLTLAPPDD